LIFLLNTANTFYKNLLTLGSSLRTEKEALTQFTRRMKDENKTSHTLLGRALDLHDEGAWSLLYEQYHKFIYYFLRQMGVEEHDLDDLSQQVMVTLMNKLKEYDSAKGKFRNWLMVVIRTTTLMHYRKENSIKAKQEAFGLEIPDGKDTPTDFDEMVEKEWAQFLTQLAMERLKKNFRGDAIKVFDLGLQGYNTKEIAEMTGLTTGSVYTLRRRVKKSFTLEAKSLIANLEGEI